MGIIAAGQITVVDLSDAPVLNTFITASRPTTQTYSKDSRTYKPSYASTPQVLTLKVTKAGSTANIIDSISSLHWFVVDGPIKTEITSKDNRANEYISGTHNEILTTKLDIDLNKGSKRYEVMGIWPDPSTGLDVQFGGYIDLLLTQNGATGPQGPQGNTGNGIANTVITYGLSMSDTTEPATWSSERPALVKGMYLWTRTVIIYTNGGSTTSYQISYIAKDADATAEIDKAKQELLEKLETVRDESLEAVDEAKQQLVTVRDESLAAAEEAKQGLINVNTKVDNAKAEIDKAKQDLTNVASELNTAKQDLADSVSAVNTKVDNAKEELTQAKQQLETVRNDSLAAAEEAKQDLANVNTKVDSAKAELTQTKQQLTNVANDLSQAKTDLQTAVSAVDTKATNLKSDLTQAKQDLTSHAQQLQTQANAQTELSKRVTTVESTANGTKTTVNELSKTVAQNGKDITSVTNRTKTVEDDLAGTKTTLSQVKTTADSTSQKTAILETGLDGLSAKFDNLKIGGTNLIKQSTAQKGVRLGMGAEPLQDSKHELTDWIKIEPSTVYTLTTYEDVDEPNMWYSMAFYSSNADDYSGWISRPTGAAPAADLKNGRQYTSPANAAYAKVSYPINYPKVKLERGNIATDYNPSEADLEQKVAEYKQNADQNYASLQTTVQNLDGTVQHNKTVAEQTAAGFKTRIESLETYKNGESERANAYFESAKTETAKQLTAERTAIAKDYVAKSTYTNDVTGIRNDLTATTTTANTTKTNLANYQASNDRAVANLQSNLQTANGDISSLKTKVEAVPGQITSAVSAVESKIPTNLDSLNLMTGTRDWSTKTNAWHMGPNWSTEREEYQGLKVHSTQNGFNGSHQNIFVKNGDVVTFSFFAKATNTLSKIRISSCWDGSSVYQAPLAGVRERDEEITITSEWKRYSKTVHITSDGSLQFRTEYNSATIPNGNTFYVAGLKLAKSSQDTGYSENPTDVATQISSLSSELKQTADGITLLATKTEVNNAKNELQSGINTATNKANAAQNTANNNAQTISTHTTQISALNTGLQAKVSQTDFNTLSGRVTTAENNITAKANELSSKITSVESKIPTSVGARNYIRNYGLTATGWTSHKSAWKFEIIKDSTAKSGQYLKATCTTVNTGISGFYKNLFDFSDGRFFGKQMTWAMDVKTSKNTKLTIGCEWGNTVSDVNTTTNWQRFSKTFKVATSSNQKAWIFYSSNWNVGDIVYIRDVQLEDGSIATSPVPAIEDTESDITKLSSELTQTKDGITLLATKTELNNAKNELQSGISTATNKANAAQNTANNNAQTISTHTTQISALNTGLQAKVSQSDFNTLSGRVTTAENNITAKANELSSKITSVEGKIPTSVGARNYIRNYGLTATGWWNTSAGWKFEIISDSTAKSGQYLKATCTTASTSGGGFHKNLFDFSDGRFFGKQMTWSMDVKLSKAKSVKIGPEWGYAYLNTNATTEWKRYSKTFTVAPTTEYNSWVFYTNDNVWNVGDIVYIRDVQLEDGSIATSPVPAIEDTASDITKLSTSLSQTSDGLKQLSTKVTSQGNTITSHTNSINSLTTGLQAKVSQTDFNTLSGRVTTAENNITAKANELSSKITSVEGAIEDAQSDITKLSSEIKQTADGMTLLATKTEVNSAKNDLQSGITTATNKANAAQSTADGAVTKANAAQNTANNNAQTISTHTTQISALNTGLSAKVSQSDFNTLSGRVTTAENNITAKANELSSKISSVEGKIPTTVGGRNYLRGTSSEYKTYTSTNYVLGFPSTGLEWDKLLGPLRGKTVTVRAYIKNDTDFPVRIQVWANIGGVNGNTVAPHSEGWSVGTGKLSADWTSANVAFVQVGNGANNGGTIKAKEAKLEIGNIPTDWSPAPEDAISQINAVSSELKQTKDGITLLATKTELNTAKSDLQSGINTATNKANAAQNTANSAQNTANSAQNKANNNAQTISTHTTQISALNTGLSAKVSQTDFNTLSGRVTNAENNITAKANELSSKITSVEGKIPTTVGARNYIRNYGLTATGWRNTNAGWSFEIIKDSTAKSGQYLKATCTTASTSGGGFHKNLFDFSDGRFFGKQMTWSLEIKLSKAKSVKIGPEWGRAYLDTNATTEWKRYSKTFTVATTTEYNSWVFYTNDKVWNVGDIVYIRDVQLEDGSIATSPVPAIEDTASDITKLSSELTQTKDGITLLASKTELNNAKNELQSGINTATNKANNNAQTINTHTTQISALNTGLQAKVSQTEFNTLSGRVTNAENNITAKANELSSKITSVEGKIPTTVGGRNYALKTGDSKSTSTAGDKLYDLSSGFDGIADNATLIIEFDWRVTAPTSTSKFRINRVIKYSDGTAEQWNNMIQLNGGDVATAGRSGHYSGTFTKVPYNGKAVSSRYLHLNQSTASGTVTISNLSIRVGSLKSDWQPAPEDTISQISSLSSELKQTKDGITLLATKTELNTAKNELQSGINTATNKANSNAQTISTHTSQISALNTGLSAKVSQSDFNTLSGRVTTAENNITAKANELSSKITSVEGKIPTTVGGRNYIRNYGLTATGWWNTSAGWKFEIISDSTAKSGQYLKATCTTASTSGGGFHKKLFDFSDGRFFGKKMTWSMDVKLSKAKSVKIGPEWGYAYLNTNATTEWKRYSKTFTVAPTTEFNSWIFYTNDNVWNVGDIVYIRDVQLEDGSIVTSPVPAIEDTKSDINAVSSELKQTTDAIKASVTSLDKSTVKSSSLTINSDGIVMKAGKSTTDVANAIGSYFAVNQNAIDLFADKIKVKGNMIVSGSLTADMISGGQLRSTNGATVFNLNAGTLTFNNNSGYIQRVAGDKIFEITTYLGKSLADSQDFLTSDFTIRKSDNSRRAGVQFQLYNTLDNKPTATAKLNADSFTLYDSKNTRLFSVDGRSAYMGGFNMQGWGDIPVAQIHGGLVVKDIGIGGHMKSLLKIVEELCQKTGIMWI